MSSIISERLKEIDDYEVQEYIGSDSFRAIDKESKKEVVIQFFDYHSSEQNLTFKNLNFINHPIKGFINLINGRRGSSNDRNPYFQYSIPVDDKKKEVKNFDGTFFVTPFMKNGSISEIIPRYLRSKGANHDKMNPTLRSKIIFAVASSLKRLEKQHFSFYGLSFNKIFLDDNLEPILKFPLKTERSFAPSYFYSPEEMEGYDPKDSDLHGLKSDVFSFAIMIYLMFSENIILNGKIQKGISQFVNQLLQGRRPSRPENIPDSYWDLVQLCWAPNPDDRPNFEEITEQLKEDKFAIDEFGMTTDLDELKRFQVQFDN